MAAIEHNLDAMPVVKDARDFDPKSGSILERVIFNHRLAVVIACALATVVLAYGGITRLVLNASFEKMIPQDHPYIRNYLEHKNELRGLGNSIRVVVENTQGDIFDEHYLEVLKQVNDEIFLTPGVDRAWVKSLWTPAIRWTEVTEEGFQGGPVMPDRYDGSAGATEQLRANIARSPSAGSLIANDLKSSMIFVPLVGPRSAHRRAARLPRVLPAAGGKRPREVRAVEGPRKQRARQGDRPGQGAHHRLREADRRADRRSRTGDGVLRRRGADRGHHHLRVHPLHPQHAARDRMLADSRHLAARPRVDARASSWTRSRSSCRSWYSRSGCRTARRR